MDLPNRDIRADIDERCISKLLYFAIHQMVYMAEFLTTAGTISELEQIITKARQTLVFITPYVQLSKNNFERLRDVAERRVPIKFVYGKSELNPDEMDRLTGIRGLTLYYFDNLHAKCYFNEETAIITSMNLYDYSSKNREMGVLIKKREDASLYGNLVQEANSIIKNAEEVRVDNFSRVATFVRGKVSDFSLNFLSPRQTREGCCIRCHNSIPTDVTRPYCNSCFNIWNQFGNWHYVERFCHHCGRETDSSMERPLCYQCFKNNEKANQKSDWY